MTETIKKTESRNIKAVFISEIENNNIETSMNNLGVTIVPNLYFLSKNTKTKIKEISAFNEKP